jgi:hypothetical protein
MYPQKRRQRVDGVDDTKGATEIGAEAAHGIGDEVLVGDGIADVDEGVREALEATIVIADTEVALLQAVKVLQSVDGALGRIVEEETANGVPDGEGRRTALEHHVVDRLGHGEVDPRDNAMADLGPLHVELPGVGVGSAVDMVEETELAKGKFKERAPGGVIGFLEIQNLWHMVADVQHLDGVGGDRSWSSDMEGIEFMCVSRRAGRGGGRKAMRHGREV